MEAAGEEETPPQIPSPPEPTTIPEPEHEHEPEPVLTKIKEEKPWHQYVSEDLPRTVAESADTAIRSARSFQLNSSTHFRTLQDFVPCMISQGRALENAFFGKVKDELMVAKEYPFLAGGLALTSAMLLMRGPRRFLFRQTLGRFQSEEAQFVRAEKNVNQLKLSVELMKNESAKLLERAGLAEKEMKDGQLKLMNAGAEIRRLAKSVSKVEAQANDLMDGLREISGREALKLRAEVASMTSLVRQQKMDANKRIMKLSDLGLPI